MAARYWVGGNGAWDDTAHWSASSGGASGASVPTSADDVFFDNNSGSATVTSVATMVCNSFTASKFIGGFSGNGTLTTNSFSLDNPFPNTNDFSLGGITLNTASVSASAIDTAFKLNSAIITTQTWAASNVDGGTSQVTITGGSLTASGTVFNEITFTNNVTAGSFTASKIYVVSSGKTVNFGNINGGDFSATSTGAQTVINFNSNRLAITPTSLSACNNIEIKNCLIDVGGVNYIVFNNCTNGGGVTWYRNVVFNNNAGAIALF